MNFSCNTKEKKQGKTDQCRKEFLVTKPYVFQFSLRRIITKPVPNPATANWQVARARKWIQTGMEV